MSAHGERWRRTSWGCATITAARGFRGIARVRRSIERYKKPLNEFGAAMDPESGVRRCRILGVWRTASCATSYAIKASAEPSRDSRMGAYLWAGACRLLKHPTQAVCHPYALTASCLADARGPRPAGQAPLLQTPTTSQNGVSADDKGPSAFTKKQGARRSPCFRRVGHAAFDAAPSRREALVLRYRLLPGWSSPSK
jgi:hypothetical protein